MEKSAPSRLPSHVGDRMKNKGLILTVSTIVLFCMGFLYSWTVVKNYIELPDNPDISDVWLFIMLAFTVGIFLQGIIPFRKFQTQKLTVAIATVIAAAGLFLSSFATQSWHLFVCYGVMFGLGTGYLYNAWVAMAMRWFPDKGGFATGVLLMGFGVTTFIFGFFASSILSKDSLGWKGVMRLVGIIILVVGLLGLFFFREAETEGLVKKAKKMPMHQLTFFQMIKDPTFWFYTAWKMILKLIGISMSAYATTMLYVMYARQFGMSLLPEARAATMEFLKYDATTATVFGVMGVAAIVSVAQGFFSVGNGFGRVPLGMMHDRIGAVKSLFVISGMNILGTVLAIIGTNAQSLLLMILAVLILGLGYAGCAMEGPAFMNEVYGNKNVRANMGFNALTTIPPIVIGSKIAQSAYNRTGELTEFFIIAIILAAVSAIAVCFIPAGFKRLDKKYGNDREGTALEHQTS